MINYVKNLIILAIAVGAFSCRFSVFAQSVNALQFTPNSFLGKGIAEALQNHPDVKAARAQIEAAQGELQGASWQFWPTPSISAEGVDTRDKTYAAGDGHVLTLRLQQPLWTGGRLSGNLARSQARLLDANANLCDAQQRLALQVIQSWVEAAVAHDKLVAYEINRDAHARLLALVQRRAKEGLSSKSDVDLAHSRLESILAESFVIRAQIDIALDKFNQLTFSNISLDHFKLPQEQYSYVQSEELDVMIRAARENSPQLAKARAQNELAQAEIQIAKSAFLPEVYVRAERQVGSYSYGGLPPQNRVFVGLTTAFGGGLSAFAGVQAATARNSATLDDLQARQLLVDEQIRSNFNLLRNANQRIQSLERAKTFAVDVSSSLERQFLAGRKQWQELMNAARERLQTETQLIDAQGALYLSSLKLLVLTQDIENLLEGQVQQAELVPDDRR